MIEERGVYYAPADCLGVWRRILIDVIDFNVTMIATIAIAAIVRSGVLLFAIWPCVWITYFVFLKGTYRTVGYIVGHARIVNVQGELPSYRALAYRLAFVFLGMFFGSMNYLADVWWLSDGAGQALRDKCTRTYVIRQDAQPAGIGRITYGVVTINGGMLILPEVRRENLQDMNGVLDSIGNTSLVALRNIAPGILVKLEWENPTGSMKDRMAQAVIERAEADGRLKPGDTVIEYTGGSTGASLAMVCAAKGYRIRIVSSEAFSREKLTQMAAFGAELTLVPSEGGMTTKKLILDMVEAARRMSEEPNTYWTDQLNNHDSIAGYFPLAEEIWAQTRGKVDAFVHSAGTGASSRGVATILRKHNPNVHIAVVEPAESPVLSGGQPGPHKIEGVGIGYIPPLWDASLVDEVIAVKTNDAKEMARRLAREEALFAGTSSGANVIAAMQVAARLGPRAAVVTLMCDSGLKYVNTDVYKL